jgi:hypothetical protein
MPDWSSDGESGALLAGAELAGAVGTDGGGTATGADALVADATLLPAPGRGSTSRLSPRISLFAPDGGALTTVGRRLRSLAAKRAFCSGESC